MSRVRLRHWAEVSALPAILAIAFVLRAWAARSGVPHAVGIDEPAILDRALRILNTGDWNTHIFDYPTLVIYLHAIVSIALFLGGAVAGAWSSLAAFDIEAVYVTARLVTAVIGTLTVWLVFRIGEGIGGRALGLLAAAQLAALPMHVRESHYALTDVPVTALSALAVWLAMRAARERTVREYALAGAACGLAAAAKYNGVIVVVAPAVAWLVNEPAGGDRVRKAGAAIGGAVAAFLVAAPFALLDYPAFLAGFAAQAARFSAARAAGDPSWLLYLKHLALMGRLWLPAAALGLAFVLARRSMRARALPLIAFGAAYFYTLATHGIVFARYALPLLPVVSVLAAVPVVEAVRALERSRRRPLAGWAMAVGAVALTAVFTAGSIVWIRQFQRDDTRTIVADWMQGNLPAAARVAVENSGPTYLTTLGFAVVPVELMIDHPLEWYREQGVAYLVVSSRDVERNRDYLKGGPIVFESAPSDSRWGPPIRVVRVQ
jgi:4-amino-4-deoxy-L-arabinose transferase-like glycosyltransferase